MNQLNLNGTWQCFGNDEANNPIQFNLTIPGTVHSGMIENNLIKDIFYSKNADKYMWIENKNWMFIKEFDYKKQDDLKLAELEFCGLDTYCNIFLNDTKIAFCDNMHITYTIDVTKHIRDGKNTLKLEFLSPAAQVKDYEYGICHGAFAVDRMFTRRMQCTYGWDWCHRLVTMGIWRDVTLYTNRLVKIDCLNAKLESLTKFGANMELYIDGTHHHEFFPDAFFTYMPHEATSPMVMFTVTSPDGEKLYSCKKLFREAVTTDYITIENPQLWYPNGYGESPLYTLSAEVSDENGNIIDEKTIQFGIRDINIVQIPDKKDSETYKKAKQKFNEFLPQIEPSENEFCSFIVTVNGDRTYCRGGNWVPANPFPANVSYEKLESLIKLAHNAGINMLRVWGGGYFECDDFYNLCDKYGILVQQDFLMACGTYPYSDDYIEPQPPEYAHFTELYKIECEHNIKRLVSHPSIAWFNGDNENQMSGNENSVNNSRRLSNTIVAPLIGKYDGTRKFFTSSPWGGSHFNSPAKGMFHATGFLDFYLSYIKNNSMDDYIKYFGSGISRFANETPVMSSIAISSLRKFIPENEMTIDSFDCFDYHTKNHPAKAYKDFHLFDHIDLAAKKIFGDFKSDTDRLLKMNLLGYEWIRAIMESYRRNSDFTSGNLFWMYNDCWPAIGWSMVDYYCVPKTAYYAMKRTSQKICTSIIKEDGKIKVYVSNCGNSDEKVSGKLYFTDSKHIKKTFDFEFLSASDSSQIAMECDYEACILVVCDIYADSNTDRTFYSDVKPGLLNLEPAKITFEKTENSVTLTTDNLAMFITLDGEAVFSDNAFLLLPGETKTVTVKKALGATSDSVEVYSLN